MISLKLNRKWTTLLQTHTKKLTWQLVQKQHRNCTTDTALYSQTFSLQVKEGAKANWALPSDVAYALQESFKKYSKTLPRSTNNSTTRGR